MWQVYSSVKGARLLMCAPQNFSADLLFKALSAAGITTDYMIRLNDPRVPPTQVSHHVVAVHCVLPPFCCCALHLVSVLLLYIAPCLHIVAVHCTLRLRSYTQQSLCQATILTRS